MPKKLKIIKNHSEAIKKLYSEVTEGKSKIFKIKDFPSGIIHNDVLNKSFCCTVAVSGTPAEDKDYILIVPHRIDSNGKDGFVVDLDPFITVLDSNTGTPAPSGCFYYHGKFDGRTIKFETEMEYSDSQDTVKTLRETIETSVHNIEDASPEIINAMHYMAQKYKSELDEE